MADALTILTSIAVVLLAGILTTVLANKLRISNVLLLLILGILLNLIPDFFEFTDGFLISISVLALVIITFDGTSRLKLGDLDRFSGSSSRLMFTFAFLNLVLLGLATTFLVFEFSWQAFLLSAIFAVIMAGTDPASIFSLMKGKMTRAAEVLQIESLMNTPLIVIIPLILLDILLGTGNLIDSSIDQIVPLLQQIIVGIGSGIIVGIVIFKTMKNFYHHELSPLAIITGALMSYILAENLSGNGILAVATMGVFFGNIYVKEKIELQEFSAILSNALHILVFVLMGFLISLNQGRIFYLQSVILFGVLLFSRWMAVTWVFRKEDYTRWDKLFMILNIPKGIAVAAVVFSIAVNQIEGMEIIIDLIFMFLIYSLLLSTIVSRISESRFQKNVVLAEPSQAQKVSK